MVHEIKVTNTTKNNELINMENIRRNINFENLTDAEMETVALSAQQEVWTRQRNGYKRNEKKTERLAQRMTEQHEWNKKQIQERKTFEKESFHEISAIKKENAITRNIVDTILTVDSDQADEILLRCHARGLYLHNGGYFKNSNFNTENKVKRFARRSLLDEFGVDNQNDVLLKDYYDALEFADNWLPNLENKK